jgi:hypothetical protein
MGGGVGGGGGQCHAPAAFTPGKDPVPLVQEAGWAPGTVWIGAKISHPTAIRSLDLPARRELLYRQRYPGSFPPEDDGSNVFLALVCRFKYVKLCHLIV